MPYSDGSLRPWLAGRLTELTAGSIRSVVDVGAGAGLLRQFFAPSFPGAKWTAVEIWEPYVSRFGLDRDYNDVIVADARTAELPCADLYLFGDMLEHMPAEDAVTLWKRARLLAPWLAISLPVLDYPQGEFEGNPFEAHVHQWSAETVLESFAGIVEHAGPVEGSTVGAFIARGIPEGGTA